MLLSAAGMMIWRLLRIWTRATSRRSTRCWRGSTTPRAEKARRVPPEFTARSACIHLSRDNTMVRSAEGRGSVERAVPAASLSRPIKLHTQTRALSTSFVKEQHDHITAAFETVADGSRTC